MELIIRENYDAASDWTAEHIISAITAYEAGAGAGGRPFVLGLPTGSSPLGTYSRLIRACSEGRVSFKNVITFNMDEYAGLPAGSSESYKSFMHENLFDSIDILPENIHILDGNAPDCEAECRAYEDAINAAGGIDLFLGGCGADGHLAFNEPFTSLSSRTGVRKLTYDTRLANSRFFGGDHTKVPEKALSVGVGTVMDAKEVVLVVTGHNKSRALRHAVEEPVSQQWTVSALQLHPNAVIVCDEDACCELKVGTYKYFKERSR